MSLEKEERRDNLGRPLSQLHRGYNEMREAVMCSLWSECSSQRLYKSKKLYMGQKVIESELFNLIGSLGPVTDQYCP
jgi:hypothetical protein